MRCLAFPVALLFAVMSLSGRLQAEEPRAAVIVAVVQALGGAGSQPAYADELQTARLETAREFFCSAERSFRPLPAALRTQIIESVLETLRSGDQRALIEERPSYLTDLIATAITSFEYGRLLSISEEDRAAMCGT